MAAFVTPPRSLNSSYFQLPESEESESDSLLHTSQNIQADFQESREPDPLSAPPEKRPVKGPSTDLHVSPTNLLSKGAHFLTPQLTGKYRVGVKSFYAGPEKKLVVDVHYPGIQTQSPAYRILPQSPQRHPMNTDGIEDPKQKELLENLWVRSQPGMEAAEGKFPVVVLSHGMASNHFEYQHLVEELASHGYCVMTISHPESNPFSPFGQVDPEKDSPPNHVDAMEAMEKQAQDLLFVIDQIRSGAFIEQIDIDRIGVMGHSLGADTALRACSKSDLIRTAIDLDGGSLRHDKDPAPIKQPVLSIGAGRAGSYGDSPWPAEKEWNEWYASNKGSSPLSEFSELQIIHDADHEDFTLQPLFNAKKTGKEKEGYSEFYSTVSKTIVDWFDTHLKKQD